MKHAALVGIALTAAVLGLSGPARADDPAGTAVGVIQSTVVEGQGGQHALAVSGPVYTGDRIKTNASGQAQLQFRDQTRLVVGRNSSVVIDSFVFSGQTAKSFSIDAVKGTLRFITGTSPKAAYSIKTPTATIGVRGTRFDISVFGNVTNFALYEGGARICDLRNRCVDVRGACEVAIIPAQNDMQRLSRSAATSQFLAENFPYAQSQSKLLPEFRVDTSGCGSIGGPINPQGGPGAPPSTGDGGEGQGQG